MPIGKRGLFEAHSEKNPGIVDEDVEAAETIGDGRDCGGPILLAGNVETRVDRLGPGTLDRPHGLPPTLVEHIADGDLGPRLGHKARGLRANAASRTRNKRNLAIETIHNRSPELRSPSETASHS